jgi:hypothetical protein
MKRDMDLVRDLLLEIEGHPEPTMWEGVDLTGRNEVAVIYHLNLLQQGGYVTATELSNPNTTLGYTLIDVGLTMAGHDFVDSVRDPEVFKKAKSGVEKVGSWTLQVFAEMAKGFALAKARDLGLPI